MAELKLIDRQEGGQALHALETKAYEVTANWDLCWLCTGLGPFALCVWPYVRNLVVSPEEVTLEDKSVCCTNKKRVPYGELGSVEIGNCCGCAAFGGGALGANFVPGWGGKHALVAEIVGTLKERQRARGDTAQIQKAEQTANRMSALEAKVSGVDAKLDALLAHLKVPLPTSAPAAQSMS